MLSKTQKSVTQSSFLNTLTLLPGPKPPKGVDVGASAAFKAGWENSLKLNNLSEQMCSQLSETYIVCSQIPAERGPDDIFGDVCKVLDSI